MYKCQLECPKKIGTTCCVNCLNQNTCDDVCPLSPVNGSVDYCNQSTQFEDHEGSDQNLIEFQEQSAAVFKAIAKIVTSKKDLEEQEKKLKEQIKKSMELHNIKSFSNDVLKLTFVAATTSTTVDSKKLKDKHASIYEECSKISPKAAYVKIEVK